MEVFTSKLLTFGKRKSNCLHVFHFITDDKLINWRLDLAFYFHFMYIFHTTFKRNFISSTSEERKRSFVCTLRHVTYSPGNKFYIKLSLK